MLKMKSKKWKTWKSKIDLKTCLNCRKNNGKIYGIYEIIKISPPIHKNCRCIIETLDALYAGTATNNGVNGADGYLKYTGKLPEYYILKRDAEKNGYKSYLGNLSVVAPGKMLFKGVYRNSNGRLPSAQGRIWYEADINYKSGYRGNDRIVFLNDGLIFVTYDHYRTFIEIV